MKKSRKIMKILDYTQMGAFLLIMVALSSLKDYEGIRGLGMFLRFIFLMIAIIFYTEKEMIRLENSFKNRGKLNEKNRRN